MSSVPDVDNACDLVRDKILLIFDNCWADADVSLAFDAINSPSLADIMALTSLADLSITVMFKSWKSCNEFAVWLNKLSRDFIVFNREEQTQRRYVSFWVAQN